MDQEDASFAPEGSNNSHFANGAPAPGDATAPAGFVGGRRSPRASRAFATSAAASTSLSPVHYGELPTLPAQYNGTISQPSSGLTSNSPVQDFGNTAPALNGLPQNGNAGPSLGSSSADKTWPPHGLQGSIRENTTSQAASQPSGDRSSAQQKQQHLARRKRKRTCLSCQRCHQLKVKCDKELPCARCVASDKGHSCYYNYNKGFHAGRFASAAPTPDMPHDDPKAMMAVWQIQHRSRGASHWRDLMLKIAQLAGPEKSVPLNAILQNIATNACLSNFSLPGNFPFGTPGAGRYYARDAVTQLVNEEGENVKMYIDTYFEILDTANPVVDMATFQDEIDAYSKNPGSVSLCWMAQFLMVLGLGSFASSVPEPAVATEFMLAAEACLMQSPFMFRPTLATLKTLTLMVVAKQVCNATCWSVDSAWSLLGLLIRAAYTFGLPQEKNESELSPKDEKDRRNLWLTIRYIEAKVTVCAGMPPITQSDEANHAIMDVAELGMPDSMHAVLQQAFPTVMYVVSRMNSGDEKVPYADVLKHSSTLRALITHARRVCASELQFITLDTFLRRCLMVLHRPFALHEDGPALYAESYWASLECSLAVLIHYREIYAGNDDTPPGYSVLGRANVLDFFSATLTVCLHCMRSELPLADFLSTGSTVGQSGIPPRQLILETVKSCIDLWEGEKDRSVCYRTAYQLLVAINAMLPSA